MIPQLKFKTHLVTVIMPFFNAQKYLRLSVSSILNQSYFNFELILVDDLSNDNSNKIVSTFTDKRIKIIHNYRHLGVAGSLNQALKHAKGNYIARMDADDISSRNRLNQQVKFLDNHPNIGFVGSGVILIDSYGHKIGHKAFPSESDDIKKQIFFGNQIIHPTVMFRKELVKKYGNYDENLDGAEDYDLWLRYLQFTHTANIPQKLLKYRIHKNSISRLKLKKIELATIKTQIKALTNYNYPKWNTILLLRNIIIYSLPHFLKRRLYNGLLNCKYWIIHSYIWLLKQSSFLSALACRLVKITGKHPNAIHPKHLIQIRDPWYLKYINMNDLVLDIGCNNGQNTIKTAKYCRKIYGVDKDVRALSLAKKECERLKISNISFIQIDAEIKFTFKTNCFNVIMLLDVLEHIIKRDQILKEIHRMLRKGGLFLLSVPNSETTWKKYQRKYHFNSYSDPDHKIEYSKTQIERLLILSGFEVIKITPVVYDTPLVGLIDLSGGISLSLYRKLVLWRRKKALLNPNESIGLEIVCKKN